MPLKRIEMMIINDMANTPPAIEHVDVIKPTIIKSRIMVNSMNFEGIIRFFLYVYNNSRTTKNYQKSLFPKNLSSDAFFKP